MNLFFNLVFSRKICVSITPQDVIEHIHNGGKPSISDTVDNKNNLRWFEFGRWIYSSTSAFKTKFKSPLVYRNNLNAVYPEVFEFNEGMYLVEWDEQQKRYEIEHFNPGFRMGEWSENFSVFGAKHHENTDDITLGMINQGEIFSFGTFTECKYPKTMNVFEGFIPDQISRRYSVLGSDGKIYDTLTLSENGERERFLCSADGDGGDLIKFEDFTGEFCRMARSEYIYVNTEV